MREPAQCGSATATRQRAANRPVVQWKSNAAVAGEVPRRAAKHSRRRRAESRPCMNEGDIDG